MKFKKKETLTAKEKWQKHKGIRPMTKEEIDEIARCRLSR